jgi:hypothetical protein
MPDRSISRISRGIDCGRRSGCPLRPRRTPSVRSLVALAGLSLLVGTAGPILGLVRWSGADLISPGARAAVAPPVLLRYSFEDSLPDGTAPPLRNGDTVIMRTYWIVPDSTVLSDSLTVSADFSRLERETPGPTYVERLGGGVYRLIHQIPFENTRSDSAGLIVPVRAATPDTSITDRRIRLCLSNHPPRPGRSEILAPKTAPYRMGDSLRIRMSWWSESRLPLRITADMSSIEADTAIGNNPKTSQEGDSTFVISYRIPLDVADLQPEGPAKVIPIIASEIGGCGQTTDRSIRIDLDTTAPPADSLSMNPLPLVTTRDSLAVSGSSRGAFRVLVLRDRFALAVVRPDEFGRYHAVISIDYGVNRIQVRAEDEAGNSTPLTPTTAVVVTRVKGAELTIGTPYSRKDKGSEVEDDIVLRDPDGLQSATIRILNLEGDCLYEAAAPDPRQEFGFHWTGVDAGGSRAAQGYYLVRAAWATGSGQRRSLTRGLLLKD